MSERLLLKETHRRRKIDRRRVQTAVAHELREAEEVAASFEHQRGVGVSQQVRREVDAAGIPRPSNHPSKSLVAEPSSGLSQEEIGRDLADLGRHPRPLAKIVGQNSSQLGRNGDDSVLRAFPPSN